MGLRVFEIDYSVAGEIPRRQALYYFGRDRYAITLATFKLH